MTALLFCGQALKKMGGALTMRFNGSPYMEALKSKRARITVRVANTSGVLYNTEEEFPVSEPEDGRRMYEKN